VDALWAGLPVVTCVGRCGPSDDLEDGDDSDDDDDDASFKSSSSSSGDQMASRVAASMLSVLGLEAELVAPSLEAYGEAMFRLATEPAAYDALRAAIEAGRATSPLWDAKAYADTFLDGLFRAWDHHLSGAPPRDIYAAPRPQ